MIALVSEDPSTAGWYRSVIARLDLAERTAQTLYRPTRSLEGLALSPDGRRAAVVEGYSSDPGLLSGSVMIVDLSDGTTTDPWPDLQTVGLVEWIDDDLLWYARCDGTGTACGRISLDGAVEEQWRGDAFIGDEVTKPKCTIADGGSVVWTTHHAHGLPPELARFDHDKGEWIRFTSFNDDVIADTVFPDVRTIRWTAPDGLEIEGPADDAARRRGPAAAAHARARRTHVELGRVLLRLGAERGPKSFAAWPRLKEAMDEAGVVGEPQIWFVTEA